MHILVTGAAGFIGFYTSKALLQKGCTVLGVDNLNDFYSVQLKKDRLAELRSTNFTFAQLDLADLPSLEKVFAQNKFDCVINLAAQAGVRYSLQNPSAYIQANLVGFGNILELCRLARVKHLIYASSSSVYGLNSKMPFSTSDNVDHPISLYAATKKANELMAHTYSHLYNLPATGLRFFTVYGPWGRPDMALFKFTKAILEGSPIDVYNHGQMQRDFTYIDDIVKAIVKLVEHIPTPDPSWNASRPNPATSTAPYRVYNIGNNNPVSLENFIAAIEVATQKKAIKNYLPMQSGDVLATCADVCDLDAAIGFKPSTPLEQGIENFVAWYKEYYNFA